MSLGDLVKPFIMKSLVLFLFISMATSGLLPLTGFAQSLAINTDGSTAHPSAMLDIKSNTKGMLIPRTSTVSRLAIPTPAMGLIVYDTTTHSFWYYDAATWKEIASANNTWNLAGNAGTDTSINFIGTTDAKDLLFKTNNIQRMALRQNGTINVNGIGFNTIIGDSAGANNSGQWNQFVGYHAGKNNTTGAGNTASGASALYSNNTGNANTAFGINTLLNNVDGDSNTVVGSNALSSGASSKYNTVIGANAGINNTGWWTTIIGIDAGLSNQISGSVFIGSNAGMKNSTGYYNTFTGDNSGRDNTTGGGNTFYGRYTGPLSNGDNNSFFGRSAGFFNTSGENNVFIGALSGASNTTGVFNTAVGSNSLYSKTTGNYNTAIGGYALYYDTSGNYNTSVGYGSLFLNKNGSFNTAVGEGAIYSNTTGYSNTAVGYAALISNTTSADNVAVGDSALLNSTGSFNTAVGTKSLVNLFNGTRNIAVGYNSGNDPGSPNVINTISIGNEGILNAANNQAFFGNLSTLWNGGNKTWSTYSDARMKNNITEDVKGLDFITRLKPVTYHRSISAITKITGNKETSDFEGKYDVEKIKETGFLAQDVEQAAKAAGYDFSGITVPQNSHQLYTLSYELFVVPLVKAVQELSEQAKAQHKLIEQQQQQIEILLKRLELQEKKN